MSECKSIKTTIYRWLDGELKAPEEPALKVHLTTCLFCQKEFKSIQEFQRLVKETAPHITPSVGFEAAFWNEVSERQKEPWFIRLLQDVESLLHFASISRAMAALFIALFIGSAGGVVSAMNSTNSFEAEKTSVQYLSGFHEFQGAPLSSVAASYLKSTEGDVK